MMHKHYKRRMKITIIQTGLVSIAFIGRVGKGVGNIKLIDNFCVIHLASGFLQKSLVVHTR